MKKQAKKGFTIVELVIVIALIAILAAVLIPTFSNVINNAHESSDTMMVKNLNTILNSEETLGNGAKTMQEAVDQAEEGGYKVDKLTPTSTGDIVWDQESNRFLLVNAKKEVVYKDESATGDVDLTNGAYKLWKITRDATKEDKGYSLYLAKDYKGGDLANLTVTAGVDVGEHNDVAAISYTGTEAARKIIFRTNGGTLTVDGAKDTVNHYGASDKVVVAAVAGNSFHEYGKVNGTVEIVSGHFVIENNASVGTIQVADTAVANNVKLTNKTDSSIVVKDADNKISADSSIGENSVKVADNDAVALIGSKSYNSLQTAFAEAKDGDTVKLIADYKIPESVTDTVEDRIIIKSKITLDFGSYRVIGQAKMAEYGSNFTAIIVDADTTFIAEENGGIYTEVSSEGIGPYGVNIRNGAKLTVKGGSYFGGGTAIQVQKGELEILDGKFSCAPYDEPYGYKYLINAIDAAYKAGTAQIKIRGGSFYKFDPANSKSENPNGDFVGDNYRVDSVDEWYTVVPNN